ncbi:hypothetical protein KAFR_0F01500 [Kazachstania africana CBS 2517]|uniref:Uncharacterized protein n=1 Tax=Kazachstania africana (strain ATCC 22294 / BCRC 22015 / CBS 2517 / CECT 1963 / NBRC 1671 / NRRL Y-8276) TaxID=1071382 RepID=H2AWJ7_KAZAF|nr:hypothetical protein KAFR_0F01500 [Kazachstania africana CBS 2517]CCF58747.1 hypothetical protein KAFR_0F01500 [Kazachstania africana CBS 2517]
MRVPFRMACPPRTSNHSNIPTHSIEIKPDTRLPQLQPYRVIPKMERELNDIIDDLLEKGFISLSRSSCSSPVVMVEKKDGTYRLCVDYRALNKATISDPFPLPRIDSPLSRVGNAKIFTTLELHSCYHQIPMHEPDKFKTAFVTPNGKYEYNVMPFGLVNAPSTFARYMADLFRDLKFVAVYLDDILIISETAEEHWQHLDMVLGRLEQDGLIAKKKKCHFATTEVEFLGYNIGVNKIAPLVHKCDAIAKFPVPSTVKEAQRFLGMINYYRRCSQMSKPIQDFITQKVVWSSHQDTAFNRLKETLTSPTILVPFQPNASYKLTTDASKDGVGAVLEEVSGTSIVSVGYFSKSLPGAQKNYPAGELELLGITEALRHFRYLLHGTHFTLRTDHISLLSLQNTKEPAQRVQRWLDELSEYEFTLEYLANPRNVVVDAISRAVYTATPNTLTTKIDPSKWIDDYRSDPLCAGALLFLGEIGSTDMTKENSSAFHKYQKKVRLSQQFRKHFSVTAGILYYDTRLAVPLLHSPDIIFYYHNHNFYGGHFGTNPTVAKIIPLYYWPHLTQNVKTYIRSCLQCQLAKSHRPKTQGLLQPLPIPEGRWMDISLDFASGFSLSYSQNGIILIVVDRFSKRAHFIPTKKPLDSAGVINLLFRHIFAYHGFPRTITSDRDIRMTSFLYRELTDRLGIKLTMSSANHPQTDGQSERTIQTLNRLLRTYTARDHGNWDKYLPQIEFVYNSTPTRTLGKSPFEIDLGYQPNEPILRTDNEINARNFNDVDMTKHLKAISIQTKEVLEQA